MTKKFRAIIVDDEWLVREELKQLIDEYPEIEFVGEAGNVAEAVQLIHNNKPDVIFLDIQMPGQTGFDLLEKVKVNCNIIFITAYDQYAIRAFEVNALDYLLKPITKKRLSKTIKRLHYKEYNLFQKTIDLQYSDVLYLIVNGSLKFVKLPLIKCIFAEGNYSFIIYEDKPKELVSKTLHEWENILPEKYFQRIHRSTIVNFEYVEKIKKKKNNTHEVYIRGMDKPLIMSRRYASRLKKILSW